MNHNLEFRIQYTLVMRMRRSILPKQYPHNPSWSRLRVVAQNNVNDACVPVVVGRYIHVVNDAPSYINGKTQSLPFPVPPVVLIRGAK